MTSSSAVLPGRQDDLNEVSRRFAVAITPPMRDLIDPRNPADPIGLQFQPDVRELETTPDELHDPIGDSEHSPVDGIVHRYPDRLLLTPIRVCPVYCRFCFRRETVGKPDQAILSDQQLDTALDYIAAHPEVWEVILSGGDPLILSPRRLQKILRKLTVIEHVGVIRLHTRVPVIEPERVNAALLDALDSAKAVYIVLHTNHPRELTAPARDACSRIVDAGIPMLSQTVLLKGINDDAQTLETLLRQLVANRVKPYYLHHADKARGTSHFRTSIAAGRALMNDLRGRVSGLCQPDYVLDIPGGHGKAPLAESWTEPMGEARYKVRDYRGQNHVYTDSVKVD
jgi:lysine 2,3-aminomutase